MTAKIDNAPLTAALLLVVPLEILELKNRGGPDDRDLARAGEIGQTIAAKGDVLLFGGGRNGEARDLLNQLAKGIAILSFAPGGVRIFGQHWCGRAASISAACPGYDNPLCCECGSGGANNKAQQDTDVLIERLGGAIRPCKESQNV